MAWLGTPLDSTTPVTIAHDSQQLDVLGLLPGTAYQMQVIAYGNDLSAMSDTLEFTTGNLPADLPSYQAGGSQLHHRASSPSRQIPTAS